MESGDMELIGVEDCIRKLNELADDNGKFAKKGIRQGLRAGAKIIASALRAAAPVDSGKLRASIKVKANPKPKRNFISMWAGAIDLASSTFYGGFVNYGHYWGKRTRQVDVGRGPDNKRIRKTLGSGRPFIEGTRWMNKAVDSVSAAAYEALVDSLKNAIKDYTDNHPIAGLK